MLKVLKHGLISEENPDAAEAMHAVADAVTLCRFEATEPDHDDVVLSKILHVLLECMRCPTGRLLSDDDVCNIGRRAIASDTRAARRAASSATSPGTSSARCAAV